MISVRSVDFSLCHYVQEQISGGCVVAHGSESLVSLQRPEFNARLFHVGFVVNQVALRQVSVGILLCSLSLLFH